MADEQRGEIQKHDDVGGIWDIGGDDIVDIEIGEKHDDVGKGGEMRDSVCEGLSLTVRGHNRRIQESFCWGASELKPC